MATPLEISKSATPDAPKGGEETHTDDHERDEIEFADPLPEELKCSICLQVFQDPILTDCGHHFCQACIAPVVSKNRNCPLCNEEGFRTFPDKSTGRKIKSLKIKCKKSVEGCEWVGEYGRVEHHLDAKEGDCGFVEVECDFSSVGCTTRSLRKHLPQHMEANTHKHLILMSVASPKAGSETERQLQERRAELLQQQLLKKEEETQREITTLQKKDEDTQRQITALQKKEEEAQRQITTLHRKEEETQRQITALQKKDEETQRQITTLQKKEEEAQRQITTLHRKDEEAQQQITTLQRKDEQTQQQITTLQQKDKEAQRQITTLQKKEVETHQQVLKLEGELKEKDEQIKVLQAQHPDFKGPIQCPPFEFVMPDFSKRKAADDKWLSPPFYSHPGGYKQRLAVFANGRDLYKGTGVSFIMYTMKGAYDPQLQWPRKLDTYIHLLNHNTGKWHDYAGCQSGQRTKPAAAQERHTCWHGIDNTGLGPYLKNDCIHFRVTEVEPC